MSWPTSAGLVFAGLTLVFLTVRVSLLASDLHLRWRVTQERLEQLQEDQRNGMVTLRLDLGLPPRSVHCPHCLQLVYGPAGGRQRDWCPDSEATCVRNYKRDYPGQPLPEGIEDPDEQQQQGHRGLPADPP